MIRITSVKFQTAGRQYDFNAHSLDLVPGQQVIVETDRGRTLATVVVAPREIEDNQAPEGLKSILRIASEEDIALARTNAAREDDAFHYCQLRVKERQMEMKLVRAEYAFDGSKIIFYFTADERVDFRELVKDLARHFHTRIEMRQIGVRDEAKLVGGLGVCGRELCCCTYLTEFSPVSVKMAKEQGLALNPSKISGQCGRLLCCLSYEYETYCDLKKGMPKCGKKVNWHDKDWTVTSQNVICRKLSLRSDDGASCTISMAEYETGEPTKPEVTTDTALPKTKETPAEQPSSSQDKQQKSRRKPSKQRKSGGAAKKAQGNQKKSDQTELAQNATKPTAEQAAEDSKQPSAKRRRRRRPRGRRRPKQQNPQGEDKS